MWTEKYKRWCIRRNKFTYLKNCWETIISNKLNNTLILEDGIIFNKLNFSSNITINQNYFDYDIIFLIKK